MNWYIEVLKKYAVFNGRARRKEYWMFFLFNVIAAVVLAVVDGMLGTPAVFLGIYYLAILIPGIGVSIRRMHDTDHSGWWLFVPIVNLVFAVSDGQRSDNRFGPDPKAAVI